MSYRKINRVIKAEEFQMGNIRVKQSLPASGLNDIDPFLLLHHAGPFNIEPGSDHKTMGVGPHPHRGFEPVSFVFQGSLQHRDSMGNNDILDDGDIQWMTSGNGVIHSERPPKKVTEKGGVQEFIQLWVNIPAKDKMTAPAYQNLRRKNFPTAKADQGDAIFHIISGQDGKVKGPAKTFTPITAIKGEMQKGAVKSFEIPEGHNALLYVVKGKINLNDDKEVNGEHMVHFGKEGSNIKIQAESESWILLLTGQPIKEAISTYGPFVMNNQREIMEAIRDYQDGKMGQLIENFD